MKTRRPEVTIRPAPTILAAVRRDLQRYFQLDSRDGAPGFSEKLRILLDAPGLQAALVYRFGSWTHRKVQSRLLQYPLKTIYAALHKLCVVCYGIHIDVAAEIAEGLYIGHFSGVLIGPAKMGRDCNIAHNVTIGRRPDAPGVPVLGDRVWIGTGSVVFGDLTIGDGTTVGPLTVVSRSVPARALAVGNPMRVVQTEYDNSAEIYGTKKVLSGWLASSDAGSSQASGAPGHGGTAPAQ